MTILSRPFSRGHSLAAFLSLLASSMIVACSQDEFELVDVLNVAQTAADAEPDESTERPELKWALPSTDDDVPGDPMKIVENQRTRLQEFQALTDEALQLRPPECDTDMRVEVEGETLPVTVTLPEQPFDFRRYRAARDVKSREALRVERQDQLRSIQAEVARQIEQLGGHISQYEYITNALDVEIPVCELAHLAELKNVLGVEVDNVAVAPLVDGIQRRAAFGLPAAGHAIFNGASGATRNSGSAVRFGVIEVDAEDGSAVKLNSSHASFLRGNGTSRIVDTDRCAFWFPSYRCINSATAPVASHGTLVTSIILSDFSQGQSPVITDPTERRQRSGVAPRGTVHYYSAKNGWVTNRTAIREAALKDGVDVINMSFGTIGASYYCSSPSLSKTREALEAARDAGVVSVAAAGNDGAKSPTCTVVVPAAYATTIAVGGTNPASTLVALESVSRATGSSYGQASFTIAGGRNVSSSMIDVVANNDHTWAAGGGAIGTTSGGGTSFAAPSIAGIVGLIKHWIAYRGGLPQNMSTDPTAIRAILSLMGDGRAAGSDSLDGRDGEFGYGNVRFVNLDNDLGADGSWGIHRVSVSTGSVYEWNIGRANVESNQLQGFKAVAIADRDNYSHSPDINFQLINKCQNSGSQAIFSAKPSALQWRMRAWKLLTPYLLHNRCLWLRVVTHSAVGPTNLYVAWMLYSNDRSRHDASNQ